MKEYVTSWNPLCVDELNRRVPSILKDVKFELVSTTLSVPSSDGGYFKIDGQAGVKIIVDCTDKEYFVERLKTGVSLDDNFPRYLSNFIEENLQIHVY